MDWATLLGKIFNSGSTDTAGQPGAQQQQMPQASAPQLQPTQWMPMPQQRPPMPQQQMPINGGALPAQAGGPPWASALRLMASPFGTQRQGY